jgi:hypothetical protein
VLAISVHFGHYALVAEPVTIEVGGNDRERISLAILGRSHPGATDYWDGNWVRASVEARVGGFTAAFGADLRTDELDRFRSELRVLYETLAGEAVFETLEGCVAFRFVGDGQGHIRVEAELRDEPGVGNRLRCELELDQTYLPPIMAALDTALGHWPVVGNP